MVVTGGSARQPNGLNEAEHHRDVLLALGVPEHVVIVENRSCTTPENVLFSIPLIEERCPQPPATVIAIVKRFHRRALITLARYLPSVERIYAVDYEAEPSAGRLEREAQHFESMAAEGVDHLVADGDGWRRASSAQRSYHR